MMFARLTILTSAIFVLAACESHSSVAPVVYGADPGYQARIYNAPDQSAVKHQAAYTPPAARAAPSTSLEPVQLQPISAIYLSEPQERQQVAYAAPAANSPLMIEVRPGDTVYAISRRHNVSPQAVIAANQLNPPYTLSVGQTLRLPEQSARLERTLDQPAPTRQVVARDTLYRVQAGDTLYSISRKSGAPLKTIAQANGIRAPYALSPGQELLIPQARVDSDLYAQASQRASSVAPKAERPRDLPPKESVADIAKTVSYKTTKPISSDSQFGWPVKGKVIASFGAAELGRRNDGINIAAPVGTPVRAAADGEVVYRGSELDGFGNLLLVKHTNGFVTAYAHNDAMLVKKGEKVRQGQVIAKVGQTGAVSTPQLHFEIRQNLKSIDPVALLGTE